jgi:hypothetical protein
MKTLILFSLLLFPAAANAQNYYHQNTMNQLKYEADQRYMMNNMAVRQQMMYNSPTTNRYYAYPSR